MSFMKDGMPAKIEAYVPIINEIVSSLGVPPSECYNEEKKIWSLQKNNAKVDIIMFSISNKNGESEDYIEISSPVMEIPSKETEKFFKKLLEINSTSIGVKFAIDKDWAWLLVQRELKGLDRNETLTMLERIGNFSNDMQKNLKEEFLN